MCPPVGATPQYLFQNETFFLKFHRLCSKQRFAHFFRVMGIFVTSEIYRIASPHLKFQKPELIKSICTRRLVDNSLTFDDCGYAKYCTLVVL
jgi:hypothetical protein